MVTRPRYARPSVRPGYLTACRKYKGPYPLSGGFDPRALHRKPSPGRAQSLSHEPALLGEMTVHRWTTESPAAQGQTARPGMSMPCAGSRVIVIPLALSETSNSAERTNSNTWSSGCLIDPGGASWVRRPERVAPHPDNQRSACHQNHLRPSICTPPYVGRSVHGSTIWSRYPAGLDAKAARQRTRAAASREAGRGAGALR